MATVVAAVLWFLLWAWPLFTPPAPAHHKWPRCGHHWNRSEFQVKQLIRCEARKQGVGPHKAVRVAKCESELRPGAVGGGGLYLGLFQQHRGYWPARARTYGFAGWSALNGRANAFVSIRMARDSGWTGHWPVCGRA